MGNIINYTAFIYFEIRASVFVKGFVIKLYSFYDVTNYTFFFGPEA